MIDSREPSEIIEKLKKSIGAREEFLSIGDILLPNGYVLERKKGRDLLSSLTNNRLFEQVNAMQEYSNPMLVIVEDNKWRNFYFTKSKYIHKQYIGMMTTFAAKYPKLRIIQVENDEEFVAFVESLYKKLISDGHSERPQIIKRKSKSMRVRMEDTLTCSKSVGIKTAKRFLQKYNSIEEICNAPLEDLEKTKGASKSTAKNVYNLLHSKYKNKKEVKK